MSKKSFVAAMLCAAVLTGANATAAFAGESTGNFARTGKTTQSRKTSRSRSARSRGRIPRPSSLRPTRISSQVGRSPGARIPKEVRDQLATMGEHPGDACNGHTGFFAGGGEE